MRILILCLLLSGCTGTFEPLYIKTSEISVRTILWEKVNPVTCGDKLGTGGCTYYSENPCRIQMLEDAPDYIVADEFRHCFGYMHNGT